MRHAQQPVGREQPLTPELPCAGHARVQLADVADVRDPQPVREPLPGDDHGRVRVHQGRAALARDRLERTHVRAQQPPDGARTELRAPQDAERRDHGLDAGLLEQAGELAPLGQNGHGREARAVEPCSDREQLVVGAVAARGRVEEEDCLRHVP